jgi:hypothetical protein
MRLYQETDLLMNALWNQPTIEICTPAAEGRNPAGSPALRVSGGNAPWHNLPANIYGRVPCDRLTFRSMVTPGGR